MEYKVRVDRPDPRFAVLLLEQFGGPHGELKAAMQYFTQAMGCQDPRMRDLFMDICAEEMSHFEMVGTAIKMLGGNPDQVPALHGAPSLAILGGGGTHPHELGRRTVVCRLHRDHGRHRG